MIITNHNYEAYLLDYLENKLDEESVAALLLFLNNHPELKEQLITNQHIELTPSLDYYSDKDALKKFHFNSPIGPANLEDFCIAFYEGLLNENEVNKLQQFLALHPAKLKEFETYKLVYFNANEQIIYTDKSKLKKNLIIRRKFGTSLFIWSSIAAGIAILFTISYKMPSERKTIDKKTFATENTLMNSKLKKVTTPPHFNKNKILNNQLISNNISIHKSMISYDTIIREEVGSLIEPKHIPRIFDNNKSEPIISITQREGETGETENQQLDVIEYAQNAMKENLLKAQKLTNIGQKHSLWEIIQLTLNGYNKLTENKLKLYRKLDENGNTIALALQGGESTFGFSKKNKKDEKSSE